MHKWVRASGAILLIVGLAAAGYYGYQRWQQPATNDSVDAGIPVEVTTVKQNTLPQTIQAIGTLEAGLRVDISPQDDGHISKILFHNGDLVKKGQLLVQMSQADVQAQLKSAQAGAALAQLKYDRLRKLAGYSAVSNQDVDQALSDLRQAQALVSQAQTAVNYTQLKAPFDGYVGARQVDAGQFIKTGTTVVTLVDSLKLKVDYSVPAELAPKLAVGQKITLMVDAYPKKQFDGEVVFVSPYADPTTRATEVQAVVPNPGNQLAPGMFAQVVQVLGMDQNALVVPIASLVPSITGTLVYKVVQDKAIQVPVTVGTYWDKQAEILSGLQLGDVIVMAGQQRLRDGIQVKIMPNTWKESDQ